MAVLYSQRALEFASSPSIEDRLQAIEYYRYALTYANRSNWVEQVVLVQVAVADLFRRLGEVDSALSYATQGVVSARRNGLAQNEVAALAQLSRIYSEVQRVDSAVIYEALVLRKCEQVGACIYYVDVISDLAPLLVNYVEEQELLADLHSWEKALEDVNAHPYYLATLHDAFGHVFLGYLAFDSALVHFRRAYQYHGSNRLDQEKLARTLFGLGQAFRGLGEPDSAYAYFERLLVLARSMGHTRAEGYALFNLGHTCHRERAVPDLECAIAYYDSANSVAGRLLRRTGSDANRTSYAEQAFAIYEHWPFAWLALGDSIGDDAARAASLAVAEAGRAQALRYLMRHQATPVADSIRPPQRGAALLNALRPGTATLSYLVAVDTVLVWLTLPSRDIRIYRKAIRYDVLASLVDSLRSRLGAGDDAVRARFRGVEAADVPIREAKEASYRPLADSLAAILVPEDLAALLPAGTDLVVVPQGYLARLPFGILHVGSTEEPLGIRYPVRYAPSLETLIETEARDELRPDTGTSLVVGDPRMPVVEIEDGFRMRLSRLPGAGAEAALVARQLGASEIIGDLATESQVTAAIRGANVVHVATHAYAYPWSTRARRSYLALAPDSANDGLLTVGELLDDPLLDLSAELVVLSACQTGLGAVLVAEGTQGFQRAFLARGARSVLVSLWNVSDEATAQLMQQFYRHWLQDDDQPTKAEALRRAQMDLRAIEKFRHPLFWGPFQLVGAN